MQVVLRFCLNSNHLTFQCQLDFMFQQTQPIFEFLPPKSCLKLAEFCARKQLYPCGRATSLLGDVGLL